VAAAARIAARALTDPRTLLGAAVAAFAAGFGSLALLQHLAFETGRFDVGNLTQTVWSTANGHFLEVTDLAGREISRLGAHFDPIVAVLVPFWWAWPDPGVLLVVQVCAVALGAIPMYRLANRHLGSSQAALGLALAYLLYPATQWLVLDDFHPVALATPLLLAAWDFLDEDRLIPFAVAAGGACLTKEHIGLVVAAMGLWYAFARGRRRAGLAVAVAGAMVAVVATSVVVPHFAPGGGSPFAGRYDAVGGSPSGIVETLFTSPWTLLGEATEGRDMRYLLDLLVPLAGLPLLAPAAALVAAPELAANVLSGTTTQTSVHFHYTAAAIPALLVATIFATARVRRRTTWRRGTLPRLLVALGVVAGVVYGPNPLWAHLPFGEDLAARDHVVTAHDRTAELALQRIPPGVAVSATNTLGAHLSERRRVFSFPLLGEARWVAVDTRRLSYLDHASGGPRAERALARLRARPGWTVVFESDGILVLRRP
jgi:uncharacterized membrane protein